MGQYYKPIILNEENKPVKWAYSHDYDCGLKLMEHSYIKNHFVQRVEHEIIENPQKIVWAGDYADGETGTEEENLYQKCEDNAKLGEIENYRVDQEKYKYLVNHTKKEFIDKSRIKGIPDWPGAKIHPLPLMTAEGNGRGGGDFRGDEKGLVGKWSRDLISVESKAPQDMHEILFDLVE